MAKMNLSAFNFESTSSGWSSTLDITFRAIRGSKGGKAIDVKMELSDYAINSLAGCLRDYIQNRAQALRAQADNAERGFTQNTRLEK